MVKVHSVEPAIPEIIVSTIKEEETSPQGGFYQTFLCRARLKFSFLDEKFLFSYRNKKCTKFVSFNEYWLWLLSASARITIVSSK